MTLEDIFKNCSHRSDKWQHYFEIYERHLNKFRNNSPTIVEIGVQGGGSLEMWANYFGPNARIIGIDIDPNCANLKYDNPNIQIVIGDQADYVFWEKFNSEIGNIDICIDDGGHLANQQIVTFEKVFPQLNYGGTFICEDCHTSYWPEYDGNLFKPGTFIEYAKTYVDIVNSNWINNKHIEFHRREQIAENLTNICFYDSVVVFEKCGKRNNQRVFSK